MREEGMGMWEAIATAPTPKNANRPVDVLSDMDRTHSGSFPDNIRDDQYLLESWEAFQQFGFWDKSNPNGISEPTASQLRAHGAPIPDKQYLEYCLSRYKKYGVFSPTNLAGISEVALSALRESGLI